MALALALVQKIAQSGLVRTIDWEAIALGNPLACDKSIRDEEGIVAQLQACQLISFNRGAHDRTCSRAASAYDRAMLPISTVLYEPFPAWTAHQGRLKADASQVLGTEDHGLENDS